MKELLRKIIELVEDAQEANHEEQERFDEALRNDWCVDLDELNRSDKEKEILDYLYNELINWDAPSLEEVKDYFSKIQLVIRKKD